MSLKHPEKDVRSTRTKYQRKDKKCSAGKTPEKHNVKQLESERCDRKTFWETNQKIFEHQSKRTDFKVMCAGIWSSVASDFPNNLISSADVIMLHHSWHPMEMPPVRACFLMSHSSVSCQIWKPAMSDPERRHHRRGVAHLAFRIPLHRDSLKHSRDRQTTRPGC